MNISKEEFMERYCIHLQNRIVYPKFKYESFDEETMSYTGLVIIKTAEEMWEEENKIDNCPPKTVEQRLEEAEQKLVETEQRLAESEEEKKLLKAQVEVLSNTTDFHEELFAEVAMKVYA